MTTSERKNHKRLKALAGLKRSNRGAFEAERTRLLLAWSDEARLRVRNRELPPASELIETARLFGLDGELAWEVIKQVTATLDGPSFVTRSIRLQKISGHPALVAEVLRLYGSSSPARDREGGS